MNVPFPPDHVPPVAPDTEPDKLSWALFSHTLMAVPASTVGAGVKLMVTSSVTGAQLPWPVVVSVRVRLPELISVWVGEYTAFKSLASGEKVPRPPDHVPPVAIVTAPES